MPYQVLVVDDHKILRDGLRAIIERAGEFRVIAEADNGTDAVRLCSETAPDLVLMDVELPDITGIEATRELQRSCPSARVIILSMYGDEETVVSAIRSGARGFVLKKASSADVVDALRIVARGGSYLSSHVSDYLLERIQRGETGDRTAPLASLTHREMQVLRLIADGKSSKEIAGILQLSTETVRSYRKAMMRKLGVNNVAGLIQVAITSGVTRWKARSGAGEDGESRL